MPSFHDNCIYYKVRSSFSSDYLQGKVRNLVIFLTCKMIIHLDDPYFHLVTEVVSDYILLLPLFVVFQFLSAFSCIHFSIYFKNPNVLSMILSNFHCYREVYILGIFTFQMIIWSFHYREFCFLCYGVYADIYVSSLLVTPKLAAYPTLVSVAFVRLLDCFSLTCCDSIYNTVIYLIINICYILFVTLCANFLL